MRHNSVQKTSFDNLESDLLSALPTAVLVLDSQSQIIVANDAARALVAPIDPVGLGLAGLLHLAGANGSGELAELVAARRDGRVRLQIGERILQASYASHGRDRSTVSLFDVSEFVREAELGSKDSLTGLMNRAGLNARLEEALGERGAETAPIAVLYVDLDRFKAVNDTLGHPIGDALLIKVAERLRSATRRGDVVARMGGDEFAIVQRAPGQPMAAEALAARIVDLIGRTYVLSGHSVNVGASVGVALSEPGIATDELMKRADLALYRAKSAGRGRFSFFEPEMDERMQRRRALELDLRRAMALKEFQLAFQPQFDISAGVLTGFEALLRWTSVSRGPVSPAEFIPLAEEIGLMIPIGEWVLRTACAQAASWDKPLTIAVNLSSLQFQNPKLVETVASALANTGLAPERLELEITEGALLDDTDAVLTALRGIRALGVKISMDDFGTGYSSLSYLQKFPFHKIKIDQSFVRRMEQDEESRAIVRAVAALGAGLGMTTTAEGVETPGQLDLIRAEGCTHVQGYLTGRPMTAADALALVKANRPLDNQGDVK